MIIDSIDIENDRINRLKVVLAEKNKKGKWLAKQLGKNEATVSRWCSNTTQPSLEMLVKIAKILNVEAKDLIN
ncbi:helix-turn-helix transcriptional regulator [Bacteroides acidifaciens]|uniref:helix-turn-helix transcriptional regulator n=1 Tax=Bacteroides acidifaciens TaxID=85831 RepID=UPI002149DF2D|nr:helix-turn-helix transcriptional regulator [Bacteroides acidifaciens]MCR2007343.1 helix-turn-helix transcriptional regulator [Bacteroides acidifaciens]